MKLWYVVRTKSGKLGSVWTEILSKDQSADREDLLNSIGEPPPKDEAAPFCFWVQTFLSDLELRLTGGVDDAMMSCRQQPQVGWDLAGEKVKKC